MALVIRQVEYYETATVEFLRRRTIGYFTTQLRTLAVTTIGDMCIVKVEIWKNFVYSYILVIVKIAVRCTAKTNVLCIPSLFS